MMNRKLIVGNWKMNLNMQEASLYLHKLMQTMTFYRDVEVVVAPTMLTLQSLSLQVNRRRIKLSAQNCYWRDSGSYTGEVPVAHLRGVADYVIVGHSERRHIFLEDDREIRAKVQASLRSGVRPILCIGETLHERTIGETSDVINDQLVSGLANVTSDELDQITIAYEPVWAIGTGNGAKPSDVKHAVDIIRKQTAHLFGKKASESIRVLYGGSVDKDNAQNYLQVKGVDGLLIGGASLDVYQFSEIVIKAHNV